MTDQDPSRRWYHGSQQRLTILRAGSSITQNEVLAKVYSHRPSMVSMSYGGEGEPPPDGWKIRHDGVAPGYLYLVADEIGPDDVHPHPHPANVSRWEWLTERDLKLELIERTAVTDGERLTDAEIATLRRKQRERGDLSFAEWSERRG